MLASAGLPVRESAPEEFLPGPSFQSDAEVVTAADGVGTTIFYWS